MNLGYTPQYINGGALSDLMGTPGYLTPRIVNVPGPPHRGAYSPPNVSPRDRNAAAAVRGPVIPAGSNVQRNFLGGT